MTPVRRAVCACVALLAAVAAFSRFQRLEQPIRGFSAASAQRERSYEAVLAGRLNRDSTGAAFRILSHRFRDVSPARVRIPRADKNRAVA